MLLSILINEQLKVILQNSKNDGMVRIHDLQLRWFLRTVSVILMTKGHCSGLSLLIFLNIFNY